MKNNYSAKDLGIFEDMKKCVADFGFTNIGEILAEDSLSGTTAFVYPGYGIGIYFTFRPSRNAVDVSLDYGVTPVEKITLLYELINHINSKIAVNHYSIDGENKKLTLRSGFFVTGYFLNKRDFKSNFAFLINTGHTFKPLIDKLLTTDETPLSIMESMNDIISEARALNKEFEESKRTEETPFSIHFSVDLPLRPTHTHGLTETGMPEFLVDHELLGIDSITSIINLSHEDFIMQESTSKLDGIRNGRTLKRKIRHANPDGRTVECLLCYYRVYPDSEIVKRAYEFEDPKDLDPQMWFIQISVEDLRPALNDDN